MLIENRQNYYHIMCGYKISDISNQLWNILLLCFLQRHLSRGVILKCIQDKNSKSAASSHDCALKQNRIKSSIFHYSKRNHRKFILILLYFTKGHKLLCGIKSDQTTNQ